MKNKILAFLLVICMTIPQLGIVSFAEEVAVDDYNIPVNLDAYYNLDAFSSKDKPDANVDKGNNGYLAFEGDVKKGDVVYKMGPMADGELNAVSAVGQAVAIYPTNYNYINFMAIGDSKENKFAIQYDDGSVLEYTAFTGNWVSGETGDTVAVDFPGRVMSDGTFQAYRCVIYNYKVAVDPKKKVTGLALPFNDSVKVFAVTGSAVEPVTAETLEKAEKDHEERITNGDNGILYGKNKLTWGEEPLNKENEIRENYVLNGVWDFMPAEGDVAQFPSEKGWGYIRVPGSWVSSTSATFDGVITQSIDGVVSLGVGNIWKGLKLGELSRAWYQREIYIPENWAGKDVVVNIGRVSTDAEVYVNKQKCGDVQWPSGEVVITDFVKPGEKALLQIKVMSVSDGKEVITYMDFNRPVVEQAKLDSRGITGDVILSCRAKDNYIDSVFVKPSVRNKELSVDIELVNPPQGNVNVTSIVRELDGKEVKRNVQTVPSGDVVNTTFSWTNPKLWDYQKPNMYKIDLIVEGDSFRDIYTQEFGFREYWIEGREFFLNGKEFNMRPGLAALSVHTSEAYANNIKGLIKSNYNIAEIWPSDTYTRGAIDYRYLYAKQANKLGFPMMYPLVTLHAFTTNGVVDFSAWEKAMVSEWKKTRNDPSIVCYTGQGNYFGLGDDENPTKIGNRALLDEMMSEIRTEEAKNYMEIVRKYETTRPFTTHHGAAVGDWHTMNHYLDFIPLQEREEWFSQWAKTGDIPYTAIEWGSPLDVSFFRERDGSALGYNSEPLFIEFASTYFGDEIYDIEKDPAAQVLRQAMKERAIPNDGDMRFTRFEGFFWTNSPVYQAVEDLFITNTARSVRSYGLSGGLLPWSEAGGWITYNGNFVDPFYYMVDNEEDFVPGTIGPYLARYRKGHFLDAKNYEEMRNPTGDSLVASQSPTLSYIAGAGDEFVAKDHHFYSGDAVEKQVAVINDSRNDNLFYQYKWSATFNGQEIASDNGYGNIKTGGVLYHDIKFTPPAVTEKTTGKISLETVMDGTKHTDEFEFTMYPRITEKLEGTVYAFDPAGDTTKALEGAGIKVLPWKGEMPNNAEGGVNTLILGRHAMDKINECAYSTEAFVSAGGNLIIFGQVQETVREKAQLRAAEHVARRFWPTTTMKNHPIIAGFDGEDFRDWNGSGTLVADQKYTERERRSVSVYGYHWSNKGSVSSCAVEKPHNGGWRPLLEGEFDLSYTPLMESEYKDGYVLWCSLDLEARDKVEPMADIMLHRVMDYVLNNREPNPETRPVYLIGDQAGENLLKEIGIIYTKTSAVPTNTNSILICTDNTVISESSLNTYVTNGGYAVFLGYEQNLPAGFDGTYNDAYQGADDIAPWPELMGISRSDLYVKTDQRVLQLTASDSVTANGMAGKKEIGEGKIILFQFTPDKLDTQTFGYLRKNSWKKASAVSMLLSNLGAENYNAPMIFNWQESKLPLALDNDWKFKVETPLPVATEEAPNADGENLGAKNGWEKNDFDDTQWPLLSVGPYDDGGNFDGAVWFRKNINIPENWVGQSLVLELGAIDDFDVTYLNGVQVGATGAETASYWSTPRKYIIPADKFHAGNNLIAVRVFDNYGDGGFTSTADMMAIYPEGTAKESGISLAGDWKFKIETQYTLALRSDMATNDNGNRGFDLGYASPDFNEEGFVTVQAPITLEKMPNLKYNGATWFRKVVDIPRAWIEAEEFVYLCVGEATNLDLYVNGTYVGKEMTEQKVNSTTQIAQTFYKVPSNLLKETGNCIAVRAFVPFGKINFNRAAGDVYMSSGDLYNIVSYYMPGYRLDHKLGDDPYRYYRW